MSRQNPSSDIVEDIRELGGIELAQTETVKPLRVNVPQSALDDLKRRLAQTYPAAKAWDEVLWPNLFYWNEADRGGYFAAWEQPAIFTDEMPKAFRSIRAH